MELLEYIALKSGCEHLSDLCNGISDKESLFSFNAMRAVRDVKPEAYSLAEWQDAVCYITGSSSPVSTQEGCKQALIAHYNAMSFNHDMPKEKSRKPFWRNCMQWIVGDDEGGHGGQEGETPNGTATQQTI